MKPALMLAALVMCVATAEASPVRWTLSNVKFADGSSVTGYFVFDAEAGSPPTGLTDFRLAVSGGSILPDFVYEPSAPRAQLLIYSFPSGNSLQEVVNAFRGRPSNGTAFELLYLDPVTFLTSAGGTVALDLVKSSGQVSNGEIATATTFLTSGSLVGTAAGALTVPEPGSVFMVLTAGSLLAAARFGRTVR